MVQNKVLKEDLKEKLMRLIDYFETGGRWGLVAGNFDGQFLSWGPLQWNVGQGTLLNVLRKIPQNLIVKYLGQDFYNNLSSNDALRKFVVSNVLNSDGSVKRDWAKRFYDLAFEKEVIKVFIDSAEFYFSNAIKLVLALGFETERGFALCFDIAVQNGAPRKDHINEYRRREQAQKPQHEWERLKILANVVADLANPRWKNVVLMRKLFIAVGRGRVYGRDLELEKDFGISYNRKWYI